MKQFRHKLTGYIVDIDNPDWEEYGKVIFQNPEPEVPQGIVAFNFRDKTLNKWFKGGYIPKYDDWVRLNLQAKSKIHTIKDNNGVEWSVGEIVNVYEPEYKYGKESAIITEFKYENRMWNGNVRATCRNGWCSTNIFTKLNTRKPIVPDLYPKAIEGRLERIEKHLKLR